MTDVETASAPATLSALPPELRNIIYTYVLLDNPPQEFRFSDDAGISQPRVPALLQVNTAIRDETLALFYANAAFELLVRRNCTKHLTWLRALAPEARSALRRNRNVNLRIFFDYDSNPYTAFQGECGRSAWVYADPAWCVTAETYIEGYGGIAWLTDVRGVPRRNFTTEGSGVSSKLMRLKQSGRRPGRELWSPAVTQWEYDRLEEERLARQGSGLRRVVVAVMEEVEKAL